MTTTFSSPPAAAAFGIPVLSLYSYAWCGRWESIQALENLGRVSMIFVTDLRLESSSHVPATEQSWTQTRWL
jgi:hypothetical protein